MYDISVFKSLLSNPPELKKDLLTVASTTGLDLPSDPKNVSESSDAYKKLDITRISIMADFLLHFSETYSLTSKLVSEVAKDLNHLSAYLLLMYTRLIKHFIEVDLFA